MPKRRIELSPLFRRQLRALPERVRIRAGEALLTVAAADDTDVHTDTHPDYPADPYIRRVVGTGYRMTVLVYTARLEAVTVYPD